MNRFFFLFLFFVFLFFLFSLFSILFFKFRFKNAVFRYNKNGFVLYTINVREKVRCKTRIKCVCLRGLLEENRLNLNGDFGKVILYTNLR